MAGNHQVETHTITRLRTIFCCLQRRSARDHMAELWALSELSKTGPSSETSQSSSERFRVWTGAQVSVQRQSVRSVHVWRLRPVEPHGGIERAGSDGTGIAYLLLSRPVLEAGKRPFRHPQFIHGGAHNVQRKCDGFGAVDFLVRVFLLHDAVVAWDGSLAGEES